MPYPRLPLIEQLPTETLHKILRAQDSRLPTHSLIMEELRCRREEHPAVGYTIMHSTGGGISTHFHTPVPGDVPI